MTTDSSVYLSDLHKQIERLVNFEELRTLCFDLGVDFDNVAGEGKSARVRELILQLARRDALQSLIDPARKERPNAVWANDQDENNEGWYQKGIAQAFLADPI